MNFMTNFIRKCPECGKTIYYSCKSSLNYATKKDSHCYECKLKNAYNVSNKNNIKILLNETLISYYWIGFILADGHIEKNKRLQISLSKKDYEHLKKLEKYIKAKIVKNEIRNNQEICTLTAQDSIYIPKLTEIFDIKNNKTKNPPNILVFQNLEKEKLLSLIIGFIDGDGNINNQYKRKDFKLSLKCHKNCFDILGLFSETIDNTNKTKINNKGYAEFHVTNSISLKKLKLFAIENELPVLKRKWDLIDLNYVSKNEILIERKKEILQLCNSNNSIKEISKKLKIKYTTVYNIIKKNNFKINKHERNIKKNGGKLSEEKGN